MWLDSLTPAQAEAVDALAARAAASDGFDPLNEEARLTRAAGARHLLLTDAGQAVAYLNHSQTHDTAQVVVDPVHRRRGLATKLVAELGEVASLRLWAFRDAAPARGFVQQLGLVPERALFVMERALWAAPAAASGAGAAVQPARSEVASASVRNGAATSADTPDGVTLRAFTPSDAPGLLAVNAAAFAHHPEQGGLDADGLAARIAEGWFDPNGLILATQDDRLLGFHWTKRHDGDVGEVYVIGVDPSAQGRGLGRRLLSAGLDHLARIGCTKVILYVDRADSVAVQMYESAGFGVAHRDVLYVSAGKEQR